MVYCTYCGQSFTRDEHLERHILTHTNVKPFKCFTCHMSFARRDLLQRHYVVHGRDQDQELVTAGNGLISKFAGRTPIACSHCAKTKTKCDKKFPCSRCAGRGLRCSLRPTRRITKGVNCVATPLNVGEAILLPGETVPNTLNGPSSQASESSASPEPPQVPSAAALEDGRTIVRAARSTRYNTGHQMQYAEAPVVTKSSPSRGYISEMPYSVERMASSRPITCQNFAMNNEDLLDPYPDPLGMLDWTQMPMPVAFDGIIEPQMLMHYAPVAAHNPSQLPIAPPLPASTDRRLTIDPALANNMAPRLLTPEETPRVAQALFETAADPSKYPCPGHRNDSRNASMAATTLTEGSLAACPKVARPNLERLEENLNQDGLWSMWMPRWEVFEVAGADHLMVMHLHEDTRNRLTTITQSLLDKALNIHGGDRSRRSLDSHIPLPNDSDLVVLPPARVLDHFLRCYANVFERYYPLTPHGTLDVNKLMHCYNDRAASLLVLLMIATGAMVEARMLTGGLVEAARIILFELMEDDVVVTRDAIAFHAALVFIVQAAWSGDKWQIDIAMRQRGMSIAMLRCYEAPDGQTTARSALFRRSDLEMNQLWAAWTQNESSSRLFYAWMMVDQELALFHDTAPIFSVAECTHPMPDADRLWHAKNVFEWSSTFEEVHEFSGGYSSIGSGARPLSLRDLFGHFLDGEILSHGIEMTPLQLRFLLYPIQSLCFNVCQLLRCFSDHPNKQHGSRPVTKESTRKHLREAQALLRQWFNLAERYLEANESCLTMQISLVIFHLISLNAVTDFYEVEKLARREINETTNARLIYTYKRCIADVGEAVFHCGQVLRLIRMLPRGIRPPWWSAAIYRVALILWVNAIMQAETTTSSDALNPPQGPSFAIDDLPADHPMIVQYLNKREGVPCVTKSDGCQIVIVHAMLVVQHCIEVIDEGAATRFTDGIRAKLERVARN